MSIMDARRGACLDIAFFGSSLVSAYWNGAATYYRGLIKALHDRGHRVTFYEPDAHGRQQHRDMADPDWARVVVYRPTEDEVLRQVESARTADVIVKASGVGVFDELLERAVLDLGSPGATRIFWDVDAPATLATMEQDEANPLRALIPQYDRVLTYGGGQPVVKRYLSLGAQSCDPVYNALDPETHFPTLCDARFDCDLAFLGNRLPDREARVEEFLVEAARRMPERSFLLGGSGWDDKDLPANIRSIGHVYTADHNAFNSTPLAVLNVARDSMAANGYSPATRMFEAAGAGACIITDEWEGIEQFLEPDLEVLLAASGEDVANHLSSLSREQAKEIGRRARARVLSEHTYQHRALQVESLLMGERIVLPHQVTVRTMWS